MPNIGPTELILVLVIALIVLGPKRLPGVGRSLGSGLREFKESISGADHEPPPTDRDEPAPLESADLSAARDDAGSRPNASAVGGSRSEAQRAERE